MKSITLWLQDVPPEDGDPKKDLQGKKIFASNFCCKHQTSVIIVRPPGWGVNVECVMELLEDMARKIADKANEPEGEVM